MAVNPVALGQTVAQVRKARGLTQRDLAEGSGLTVNYLSLVETGMRGVSVDTANKLAKPLGIPSELLFFLAGDGDVPGQGNKGFKDLSKEMKGVILSMIDVLVDAPKK